MIGARAGRAFIEQSSPGNEGLLTWDEIGSIVIAEHQRKKRGPKPLPEDLPRVEIIHDISEEEKICACGAALSRIGQDTSEKLDYIPAKMRVLPHIRYKYACKACEGVEAQGPTIKIAPPPVLKDWPMRPWNLSASYI